MDGVMLPPVDDAIGAFHAVVDRIQLEVGEILGVFGRSGSGKSSYLRGVYRRLSAGSTIFLPQEDDTLPHLTAGQNIDLGRFVGSSNASNGPQPDAEVTLELGRHREQITETLSGGQRRRVALARVFSVQPRLLLLDEPFNGLGPLYEELVRELLVRRQVSGLNTVVVSHDLELLLRLSQRVVVLDEGRALDTLANGIPVLGWRISLVKVLGVSNILSLADIEVVGGVTPQECGAVGILAAWKNSVRFAQAPDSNRASIRLDGHRIVSESRYESEGQQFLHLTFVGKTGRNVDLTGKIDTLNVGREQIPAYAVCDQVISLVGA
jgi:ABC-type nitrate/sulfonate/bicarbonate transport system ATPase subunit